MAVDPRLVGLDPEFERKLRTFMSSLPANIRTRVTLNSGYRTPQRQAMLFDRAVQKYGSVQAARKWVAPPGHSMHNQGKAADLGIPGDLMGLIHSKAPEFGLRFPLSNENWHIEDANARNGGGIGEGGTGVLSGGGGSNVLVGQQGSDVLDQPQSGYDRMRSLAPTRAGNQYQPIIDKAAQAFQFDPQIVTNLIQTESNFDPRAVSPVGARGLAQFMPGTAKMMGIDPNDPVQSIIGGAKYLREMTDRYKGDVRLGLAAYNWGPGNVDKIGGDLSKAPTSVQNYVNKILSGTNAATTPNSLTDIGQQAAAGVTDVVTSLPAAAALPFAGAGESLLHHTIEPRLNAAGIQLPPMISDSDVTGWLEQMAEKGSGASEALTGAQKPLTFIEQAVRNASTLATAGGVLGGGLPGALTGGLVGVGTAGINYLNEHPGKPEDYIYNQPGMGAEASPGMESLIKPSAITGGISSDPSAVIANKLPDTIANTSDIFNLKTLAQTLPKIALAPAVAASMIPNLSTIFQNSPDVVKKAYDRYGTMGWIVLGATAAFGVGPKGVGLIAKYRPARVSDLLKGKYIPPSAADLVHELRPDVAPGVWNSKTRTVDPVQSIVRARDPLKALATDTASAIIDPVRVYLQKAGMNADFLHELEMAWQHDAAFMANINSFLQNGEMNTAIGRMKVGRDSTMSILQKAAQMDKDVVTYLNLLRMKDDFLVAKKRVIGGVTRADVIRQIQLLEQAKPNLTKVADIAKANRAAHLQFRIDAGDITQKEATKMIIERPNSINPELVPVKLGRRNPAEPTAGDVNAIDEHTIGIVDGSRNAFDTVTNRKTIQGANKTGLRLFPEIPKKKAQAWKGGPSIVMVKDDQGVPHYYSTNPTWAVLMRHGPDKPRGIVSGTLQDIADPVGWYKRIQETIGTGEFNPGYYPVAQQRARGQIHATFRSYSEPRDPLFGVIPYGRQGRPIGLLGTKLAVPRAVFPAIARNAAQNIEAALLTNTSLRWLPDAYRQGLAMRLSDAVEKSAMYMLQTHGGVSSGSFVSDIARSNYRERAGIGLTVPSKARSLWHGYQDLLFTTHGAASLGFAMKELGVRLRKGQPLEKAAMEAAFSGANVTGNPRMTGASSMRGVEIPGRPARQGRHLLSKGGEAGLLERRATEAVRAGSGLGRYAVPWYNVQVQSMRNVWNAYIKNPVGFMMSVYGYTVAPAIATYLWNAGLGKQYVDHMMDQRTPQSFLTTLPVGLPGRDPADGHVWAVPQELSIFSALTLIAMDHMLRGDQIFPTQDQMWKTLGQYVKGVLIPSPPQVSTMFDTVAKGIGQAYTGYNQPFAEPGDVPQPFEGMLGAVIGPVAHAAVQAYEAFADDKGSYAGKALSAAKEFGREVGKSIPPVRELFNIPVAPITQTQYKIELDKKQIAINELSAYYRSKGKAFLAGDEPSVDTSAASKVGQGIYEDQGGIDMSTDTGKGGKTSMPYLFPAKPPDNPIWWDLAARIQQNFSTDTGYKLADVRDAEDYATWHKKRNAYAMALQDMKGKPNYGNLADWRRTIEENPNYAEVVADMPVGDRNAPDKVYRFASRQVQEMNKRLIVSILEAEKSMSADYGREIKLEKISPWKNGWLP